MPTAQCCDGGESTLTITACLHPSSPVASLCCPVTTDEVYSDGADVRVGEVVILARRGEAAARHTQEAEGVS